MNINNPTNPSFVGRYPGPFVNKIRVSSNFAYIADFANGLDIVSITNPGSPFLLGNYSTPGTARSLWITPNYAFVADGQAGQRAAIEYEADRAQGRFAQCKGDGDGLPVHIAPTPSDVGQ